MHAALAEEHEIEFERFARELREIDRAQRSVRYRDGVEISTEARFAELLARLAIDDAGGTARRLADVHMGLLTAQVSVPEHHAGLLAELAARGPLGLCSNFTDGGVARSILATRGLDRPFHALVISEEVGFRKPRREIFDALLAGLGCAPEQTLHVGDNLDADIAGAAALGLRTAWLTRRVGDPDAALARHRGPAPDFVIADLAELPALL